MLNCMLILAVSLYITLVQVTVGFDVADMTVAESVGSINVPVTLQQNVAVPVIVNVQVIAGTATAGPGNGWCILYQSIVHIHDIVVSCTLSLSFCNVTVHTKMVSE